MTSHRSIGSIFCVLCVFVVNAFADDPCRSGPQPGQRPGPYSFVMSTGDKRGISHCYICETGDSPAVAVFARKTSAPLAKLVRELDKTLEEQKEKGLRAWVTFLENDQSQIDRKLARWAQDHAIRLTPLGVFEDAAGPPSYRLTRDADVTILMFAKQQVVVNFAYRDGELTEERVKEVMSALPKILDKK